MTSDKADNLVYVCFFGFFCVAFSYFMNKRQLLSETTTLLRGHSFAVESILNFSDGACGVHRLGSTRENCQSLFSRIKGRLDIGENSRDVRCNKRFL